MDVHSIFQQPNQQPDQHRTIETCYEEFFPKLNVDKSVESRIKTFTLHQLIHDQHT